MRVALHPDTLESVKVKDYMEEFGKPTFDPKDAHIPKAICPYCSNKLAVAAETVNRIAHFRHPDNTNCPSIETARLPYESLTPSCPDPVAGRELRKAFRKNWKRHFDKLKELAPGLSFYGEFLPLLERSLKQSIWHYVGMTEAVVPYTLVLLADFPVWTSKPKDGKPERKYWLRYFMAAGHNDISDLWIRPANMPKLYRVSFKSPKRKSTRPPYEDLVKTTPLEINASFLTAPEPSLSPKLIADMESWFDRHASQFPPLSPKLGTK